MPVRAIHERNVFNSFSKGVLIWNIKSVYYAGTG